MDKLTIFVYKKLFADDELKEKLEVSKKLSHRAKLQVIEGHYRDAYMLSIRRNLIWLKLIEDYEGKAPEAFISHLRAKSSKWEEEEKEKMRRLAEKEIRSKLEEIEKGFPILQLSDIVTDTDRILVLGEIQLESSPNASKRKDEKESRKEPENKLTPEQSEIWENIQSHPLEPQNFKWNDIIGHEEAKSFLKKVAKYPTALRDDRNRHRFNDQQSINGCLIYGPSDCGKNR
jgi:SpoVK/Ycf46/Vps4 family AAA+-type ATPase